MRDTVRGPIRLALLSGSLVPVKVPLYQALSKEPRLEFTAIFSSSEGLRPFDGGYGQPVQWDGALTDGYRARFLRRAATNPALGAHTWSVRDWDIATEILSNRYEVLALAGYNSITYLLGAGAQRLAGGEVLFREEQTLLEPRPRAKRLVKDFALSTLFRQGRALYISAENRRWFEHYGMPEDRLFAAPYTVDNEQLQAQAAVLAPHRVALRRSFGIADDAGPVILTVGRLVAKKQPLFLLDSFRAVRERVRCALLVVGSGALESELRTRVRDQSIPDVVFAGFLNRSAISKAYAAGDVFALLSREAETFGLVVPEAMNFGLPVVVSDRVGCAADLVSQENGMIVSHRDPGEASRAFESLVTDTGLRNAMGAASLRRVGSWTLRQTVDGFLAATAAAVGQHRWDAAAPSPHRVATMR